jgi:hypothetical protein
VTNITKRETIEGELGRFVLHRGEEPQAMYNWLKTSSNASSAQPWEHKMG